MCRAWNEGSCATAFLVGHPRHRNSNGPMFLVVYSHVTCASAARYSTVPNLVHTSLWCVPVCNSALADLLERLSRNARSSRTPCLDVLPRILVVLKTPEGSAANHCQIQDLWPPQRNEVPYAGAGMRWPDLSSSRNRKDQIEASDCRERSLAWKRGNGNQFLEHPGAHEGKPDGQGRLSLGGWANLRQGLSGLVYILLDRPRTRIPPRHRHNKTEAHALFMIGRGDLDSHLPTFPQEALTLKCNTYLFPVDHIYCWQLDRQVDEDSNCIEHDTLQKLGATAAISLDCLQSRAVLAPQMLVIKVQDRTWSQDSRRIRIQREALLHLEEAPGTRINTPSISVISSSAQSICAVSALSNPPEHSRDGEHTRCWLGPDRRGQTSVESLVRHVSQRDESSRQMPQRASRNGEVGPLTVPNSTAARDEHEAPVMRSLLPPPSSRACQT
ncbi:hypothetical protein BGZ57DRAFT_847575 [Hyaloscypha finlandica]|nr:hypothetical protein BGZ57DRAFT_847575 [Hyaloscypha finlandica]